MDTYSQRRRAQNEVTFRQSNEQIRARLEDVLPNKNRDEYPISFVCECSDESCHETIMVTLNQYNEMRGSNRDFIIKPGHEQLDIERVKDVDRLVVVTKFVDPPQSDGQLNRTF